MRELDDRGRLGWIGVLGLAWLTAVGCGPVDDPPDDTAAPVTTPPPDPGSKPPAVAQGPLPGDQHFDFAASLALGQMIRPIVAERQRALLDERYDLADNPVPGLTMTRGKPVQGGIRVKLPPGVSWEQLAAMKPEEIRAADLFPKGFLPLPHPNHSEGGMVFPKAHIDEVKRQTGRDLERFDLDFDLPAHLIPEFPPAIFLTTRPDLGDVSQGQAGHHRQLLRAVQEHPEPEAAGRAAPAGDARSPSSSST